LRGSTKCTLILFGRVYQEEADLFSATPDRVTVSYLFNNASLPLLTESESWN
jgi:hypothetical protein